MRKTKNKSLIILIASTSFLTVCLSSCMEIFDDVDSQPTLHSSGNMLTENFKEKYYRLKHENPDPDDFADALSNAVIETVSDYKTTFKADTVLTTDQVKAVLRTVTDKAPDLFWINRYAVTSTSDSDTCHVSFYPLNDLTTEELMEMHDELEKAADEIIAEIPEDSDDYEKILFVHDYIVNNTDYDFDGARAKERGLYHTAYGCLVDRKAVCLGYAEAFQYIMNKLSIESGVCTGEADSQSHAWNYVKVNGEYYWIDVTWDDPQAEDEEKESEIGIRHTYFLINNKMMFRGDRYVDDEYSDIIPECTCLDDNYYVKKDALFDEYSIEKIAELVSQDDGSRKLEMMFRDEYDYNQAKDCLFEGNEILLLDEYTELSDTINWACNDKMYELFVYY